MAAEISLYPGYVPATKGVIGITMAYPAVITTGAWTFPGNVPTVTPVAHNYATGLQVRFYIPKGFGMPQIDQVVGTIEVLNTTQFTVNIDTRYFYAFNATPTVNYVINPVSLYPEAITPYRTLQDGTLSGMLVLMQIPQCVPCGDTHLNPEKAWMPKEQNIIHNALPY